MAAIATETIRVRPLLSSLNSMERTELKKLLPPRLKMPEEPAGTRYPAALLAALPKEESYALLGHITEAMLRLPVADITLDRLCAVTTEWAPAAPIDKVRKSKTTEPFLTHLRATRSKVDTVVGEGALLRFEEEIGGGDVGICGHPDIRTDTLVLEVKMTGRLKENWVDFLFQVFAYAALEPAFTDLYLVLPLQEVVWHHPLADWKNRSAYRAYLADAAAKKSGSTDDNIATAALIERHRIGLHMPKLKTLEQTVRSLPAGKPHQIFLSGPQTYKVSFGADELNAAHRAVQETGAQLFLHSPYLINLCQPCKVSDETYATFSMKYAQCGGCPMTIDAIIECIDEDAHIKVLIKYLMYGAAIGARGVVVHVGKHTSQTSAAGLEQMRRNITRLLDFATPECPLLLETPAGQGTELLYILDEFAAFVNSFEGNPRLGVCVDTCHVFATGSYPAAYLKGLAERGVRTRLIHFNDSATPCGARIDRHAYCGQGHIGLPKMTEVAEFGSAAAVPMVIEY